MGNACDNTAVGNSSNMASSRLPTLTLSTFLQLDMHRFNTQGGTDGET